MKILENQIRKVSEIKGEFLLRSGKISPTYFDKYRFESDPKLLLKVAKAICDLGLISTGTEVLCGLEMGGIPVTTMLSQVTGLPSAFIRKERKAYGTCNYIEGCSLEGKKLLIVEDVVTSGGAVKNSINMMRADGLTVTDAICVIDRNEGGMENLDEIGVRLDSLLKIN